MSVATTAATYDAKSIQGARVSELRIRVDRIDESLKDILAELKQLRASIPRAIRDNAPVTTMTEQQAARRVQKLVTMNV